MKKILSIFCLFFTVSQCIGAEKEPPDLATKSGLNKTEVRAAAFVPASQRLRKVYGGVLPSLQIEQARGFKGLPNLEVWGNFEWIFSTGEQSCGKSHLNMLNISLGVKGIGSVYRDWIYVYGGVGPNLGITFIRNQAECCTNCDERQISHNSNLGVGGVVKSGCQIFVTPHFFFDIFADYLYLPMKFHNTRDIGGLKAGLGLCGRY